jgi:hypothetical protein
MVHMFFLLINLLLFKPFSKALLDAFEDLGSVKDDTLTIRTIDKDETLEREHCLDHPISKHLK